MDKHKWKRTRIDSLVVSIYPKPCRHDLFPPFKVWRHYPHFTDEETDWKAKLLAQNHISSSVADLWYLIKSLSFQTYISFYWTSCFQRVVQEPLSIKILSKGPWGPSLFFWILVCGQTVFLYFNQNHMSYQSECKNRYKNPAIFW